MGWLATLHGDLSHLDPEHRAQQETKVRDALGVIAGGLVDDGHQGVAATFHGDTTGDVNLIAPGDTPDAGPGAAPAAEPTVGTPPGQVPADATDVPDSGETGDQVERAPGTASEPTGPPEGVDAATGQETASGGGAG